jgi:hypothetical protein
MPLFDQGAAFLFDSYYREVTHSQYLFNLSGAVFGQNTNKACNNTIIGSTRPQITKYEIWTAYRW